MKVYVERKNLQVELIRFRTQMSHLIYSRLCLRTEEFNAKANKSQKRTPSHRISKMKQPDDGWPGAAGL